MWTVEVETEERREPRPSINSLSDASRQAALCPFRLADRWTASHDLRREVKCCERRSTWPRECKNLMFSEQTLHPSGLKIKSADTQGR